MKILFISKEFTPASNGTVVCLENVLPYISKVMDVILYTAKLSYFESDEKVINGVTVRHTKNFFDDMALLKRYLVDYFSTKEKNLNITTIIVTIIKCLFYPFQFIANNFGYIFGDSWEKNAYKYIVKYEDLSSYDVITAVGNPFSNIRIAYRIKKEFPHLKFIPIEFDHFSFNPVYLNDDKKHESNFQKRINEEMSWYESAKSIIILKEMESSIKSSKLNMFSEKITSLYLPNLVLSDKTENTLVPIIDNGKKHKLVYTGMFYDDIRNPSYLLQVLSNLKGVNSNFELILLSIGCDEVIDIYRNDLGESLKHLGYKDKNFVKKIQVEADFFINISNNTSSQMPSKLLEYISTGKPIINFYSIENDVCKAILDKYSNSISIFSEDNLIYNVSKLDKFLRNASNTILDQNEIRSNYEHYLPENFANRFLSIISNEESN